MPQRNHEQGFHGSLPSSAPLANPYVPFQLENPPVYEAANGIVRGTLFPGLDLPFMGMINQKQLPVTPLTELQTMAFAIQELALYLDTHRDDNEALDMYRVYQNMYAEGKKKYEKECERFYFSRFLCGRFWSTCFSSFIFDFAEK